MTEFELSSQYTLQHNESMAEKESMKGRTKKPSLGEKKPSAKSEHQSAHSLSRQDISDSDASLSGDGGGTTQYCTHRWHDIATVTGADRELAKEKWRSRRARREQRRAEAEARGEPEIIEDGTSSHAGHTCHEKGVSKEKEATKEKEAPK